jgi:hypothetical protein
MIDPNTKIGLFTIAGTIVGSITTYIFAIDLANNKTFEISADKLKSSFTKVISELESGSITDPKELEKIFQEEFTHQKLAVIDFRFTLSSEDIPSFNKVWGEYYEWKDSQVSPPGPNFVQYTMPKHDGEVSKQSKYLAINRINTILAFTKRKPFYKRWFRLKMTS